MEVYYIIAFDSTNSAIYAEKVLKEKNLIIRIIPLPTELSAGCGLSIKLSYDDLNVSFDILLDKEISFNGFYKVVKKNFIKTVTRVNLL